VYIDAALFTSHSNLCNYAETKPFSRVKPAYVGFFSSNCTVQDHIPSTIGDALSTYLLLNFQRR
jgi:hypothetical protein